MWSQISKTICWTHTAKAIYQNQTYRISCTPIQSTQFGNFIRKHLKVCLPEVIAYKNTREFITATTGIDPHLCPKCHKGEMVISPHTPACVSFLSMSRMDIDSARAEISQSSELRGSPYPDPDVKIYIRPIPAYRKVELRWVLMSTALGTAMSTF